MPRYCYLVLLAACGLESDSKSTSSLPDSVRAVERRMHERYAGVQRIEYAIVSSKLDDVRSSAKSIAALDEPDVLPAWQPYLAGVKTAALDLATAGDVMDAAPLAAELGRQCARCHQAIHARITFREPPRPDRGTRLVDTMAGHQWAVARMWEGLIAPSDDRWDSGAKVLQRAPLTFVAESGELGIADDVVLIRLFARRATELKDQADRAELFGRLLGTCVRCHSVIRDQPMETKP